MQTVVHKPVLLNEVMLALQPRAGGRYFDGTVGGGGHAEAILEASAPTGWLLGCDRDGEAVERTRKRLARFGGRFDIRWGAFAEVADWGESGKFDGAVLDLGVSSMQLEQAKRGFSFLQDGPLDMRMDQRQSFTAAQVLAEAGVEELADMFRELGEERHARRMARIIDQARRVHPIVSTLQLAQMIERSFPRHGRRLHPATRCFQALRIRVNDELAALERGLNVVWSRLKVGGRLAVISFHSLEDRVVKDFGRQGARAYTVEGPMDVPELRRERQPELVCVTKKAMQPSAAEIAGNPRARSARLRVFERIYESES